MMRPTILQRYIAKTIFLATGLAGLIFTAVMFIITLLGEVKTIGEGDYGFNQAIINAFMRLPNELYQFSPMFILLGCIMGLSTLSSHRELAVMRTSGLSIRWVIYSVFSAAILLILAISITGEWIGPKLSYKAEIRKENAKNAGLAVVTAAGVWFHLDNDFIHIQHMVGRQILEGVTRYQFDNQHRLQAAYYAKSLSFQNNQWIMHDVVKTSFYDERTKSQSFQAIPWDLKLNTNLLNIGLVNPHEMSLHRLSKFTQYLKQNGLQASEYQYDFWQRIFQPLASIIMIFLAIPFVLRTFSRTTMGWRIVAGILTGFTFFILNALLGQLCVVYQLSTLFAALFPLVLFATIGVLLLNKSRMD